MGEVIPLGQVLTVRILRLDVLARHERIPQLEMEVGLRGERVMEGLQVHLAA